MTQDGQDEFDALGMLIISARQELARREQSAEQTREAARLAEEQAVMSAFEAEWPEDLREIIKDPHVERRRDETVGIEATIRSQPYRLTRHSGEHEPANWMIEGARGYRRATLGGDFLFELGLALDVLITGK